MLARATDAVVADWPARDTTVSQWPPRGPELDRVGSPMRQFSFHRRSRSAIVPRNPPVLLSDSLKLPLVEPDSLATGTLVDVHSLDRQLLKLLPTLGAFHEVLAGQLAQTGILSSLPDLHGFTCRALVIEKTPGTARPL